MYEVTGVPFPRVVVFYTPSFIVFSKIACTFVPFHSRGIFSPSPPWKKGHYTSLLCGTRFIRRCPKNGQTDHTRARHPPVKLTRRRRWSHCGKTSVARRWLDGVRARGHVAPSRGRNVRESGVPQRLDRPAAAKKRTRAEKPPPRRRRVTPPTRQRTISVTSDPATASCSNRGRRPDTTPLRLRGVGWSGSTRDSFVRARFLPP